MRNDIQKWISVAGLTFGALVLGLGNAPARADQGGGMNATERDTSTTKGGQTRSELIHATTTVTAIDRPNRIVTLKGQGGDETAIGVPADVTGFDTLKVGDKVDVDYYQSLAVSLMPTGSKPSAWETKGRSVNTTGGVTGREMTMAAEVISVDTAANTVTFKGPHGQIRTVAVQDPQLQQKLPNLKPGQVVQFKYTQAVAASIQPHASN